MKYFAGARRCTETLATLLYVPLTAKQLMFFFTSCFNCVIVIFIMLPFIIKDNVDYEIII